MPPDLSTSNSGSSLLSEPHSNDCSVDGSLQPTCLAVDNLHLSAFATAAESCSGPVSSTTGPGYLDTKQEQKEQLEGSRSPRSNTEPDYIATYSNALYDQFGNPECAQQHLLSTGQADQSAVHVTSEAVGNIRQLSAEAAVTPDRVHMRHMAAWPEVKQHNPWFEAHLAGTVPPTATLRCLGPAHEAALHCNGLEEDMPGQLDLRNQPSLHASTWSTTAVDKPASAFLPGEVYSASESNVMSPGCHAVSCLCHLALCLKAFQRLAVLEQPAVPCCCGCAGY